MYYSIQINKKILLCIFTVFIIISMTISYNLSYYQYTRTTSTNSESKYKIVIDPGHGSIDTGTSYNEVLEKNINLEIAKKLEKEIFNNTNLTPIMTRTEDKLYKDDRNIDLRHRTEIPEEKNADLFISIHTNNFSTSEPQGSQIFFKPGSEESKKLAKFTKKELIKLRKENNRPIFEGKYYVLQNVNIPAILIECGFLSNPKDRQKLTDPEYQKEFASSIKNGILNYIQTNQNNISTYQPEKPEKFNIQNLSEDNYQLYYLGGDNSKNYLIKTNYSFPSINTLTKNYTNMKLKEILLLSALQQLKRSPDKNNIVSTIPEKTKINSVDIIENRAYINFNKNIQENFNSGSYIEFLMLKAIVNTVFSLPGIEKLQIQIEGNINRSIGGHIILNDYFEK